MTCTSIQLSVSVFWKLSLGHINVLTIDLNILCSELFCWY